MTPNFNEGKVVSSEAISIIFYDGQKSSLGRKDEGKRPSYLTVIMLCRKILRNILFVGLSLFGYYQYITVSVTRLGDLLDFGQLFKAFGKN